MEIVISVGIVGLAIPLVLGLLVVSGESSRKASDDTKAAFLARTFAQEVESARTGQSELFETALTWPSFPGGGGRLVFVSDIDGLNLRSVGSESYETGVKPNSNIGGDSAYLISVRGSFTELQNLPDVKNVSQVEISVEMPAVAPSQQRRKNVFTQLMHPD